MGDGREAGGGAAGASCPALHGAGTPGRGGDGSYGAVLGFAVIGVAGLTGCRGCPGQRPLHNFALLAPVPEVQGRAWVRARCCTSA